MNTILGWIIYKNGLKKCWNVDSRTILKSVYNHLRRGRSMRGFARYTKIIKRTYLKWNKKSSHGIHLYLFSKSVRCTFSLIFISWHPFLSRFKIKEKGQRTEFEKISFVNRSIWDWNSLPTKIMKTFPKSNHQFRGRLRKLNWIFG